MTALTTAGPSVGRERRWGSAARLVLLHLLSRQVPGALAALAGCGVALRTVLLLHWARGDRGTAEQVPLLIEAAAASVVAASAHNPFGESERSTGSRLPYLRLVAALALTAVAAGALAAGGAGAAGAELPGGAGQLLRDVAGLCGIGLLSAGVLGGALAWVGPLAYTVVAEFALTEAWRTPWFWPVHSGRDLGAALCAGAAFAAGTALIAVRGPRE
ncbi:hypothetical protein [Streptacidiphilus sp. PAMC 29251]